MGRKHKKPPKDVVDILDPRELARLIVTLRREVNAKKRIYFIDRGVMKYSRMLPDHKAQLRALTELGKLHCLFPLRGELEAGNPFDLSEHPVINLVMADSG